MFFSKYHRTRFIVEDTRQNLKTDCKANHVEIKLKRQSWDDPQLQQQEITIIPIHQEIVFILYISVLVLTCMQ